MFNIRRAEKRKAKLRLALVGVGGAGKSRGAIMLALGMKKKFIIIDSERTSADLYADFGEFDVLELQRPFTPERYIQAVQQCEAAGYELIIIDSLSHAWAGEGGILDMQDAATNASKSKNSYMAWREVTPWHNNLINTILQSNCDIIATMRAKTHYEIVNENGKARPIKLGLAPIQREGIDYEFTVVLDIDKESKLYSSSKDRTQLFEGKHEKISKETGERLIDWLNDGKSQEEIEKEEVERIEKVMTTSTLDELRKEYAKAKQSYPHLELHFLKIANERKSIIENEVEIH